MKRSDVNVNDLSPMMAQYMEIKDQSLMNFCFIV